MLILALCVVFIAAITQKITGMGFALVATPVLALIYGPTTGVLIVIVNGMLISGLMIITGIRLIKWRQILWIIAGGLITAPLAALVASWLTANQLLILVGGAALVSLIAPFLRTKTQFLHGRAAAVMTGGAAGFLHVTSGLSGPPLIAYGTKSKWEHLSFVASIQVFFVTFSLLTLSMRGLPRLSLQDSLLISVTVVLGLGVGIFLNRFVSVRVARIATFVIAWIGAISVLLRGITA